MRIGIFSDCYTPDINGVVSSIVALKTELEAMGHEVFVVATQTTQPIEEDTSHILRLSGVEIKKFYGYVITQPIHLKSYKIVESWNLDVIHAQTEFGVGMFARIVARTLHIPLIATYHTIYEDYTHYINILDLKGVEYATKKMIASISKQVTDRCEEMIAPSVKTKELLLKYGASGNITVIPTGLNLKRFYKENSTAEQIHQCRAKIGLTDDENVMLFVGRIAEEKSIDLIIDAFKYIDEMKYPCKLVIVGDGPGRGKLEKQVERLQIGHLVTFTGKKPQTEVPLYYHMADGFVSASLSETQGMTFVEALASDLPVFARKDDVLEDLVFEDKTGYYFDDAKSLADCIVKYMDKNVEQRQLVKMNCKSVAMKYNSETFGKAVYDVYLSAIERYHDLYYIDSIKSKEDCVELVVKTKVDKKKILVDLDTYFEKGFRKDNYISKETIEELEEKQIVMDAYLGCIRKLVVKDRTSKEMADFLKMKTELNSAQIQTCIDKLVSRGLINDERFAQNYIESAKALVLGKKKIIANLRKKGIGQDIIDSVLLEYTNPDEKSNAYNYAVKISSTIKNKSVKMKRYTIKNRLLAQGYPADVVNDVIEQMNFSSDEAIELDSLRLAASKAKKRYMSRYEKTKLRNTVYRYLLSQGYKEEDVYFVLSEMEWEDE